MCVILFAKDTRPTDQMIDLAWKKNDHGGGLAWRETDKKTGEVLVHWKKGIQTVEEMYEIMSELPLPYVAHFRIASSGGIRQDLCHPFPVCEDVPLALEGTTNGNVLFHNGDWNDWDAYLRFVAPSARASGIKLPSRGRMNDTRTMAWLTHVMGDTFLELLPTQKGLLFGPKSYDIFLGKGWVKINDVYCSNEHFWPKYVSSQGGSGSSKYTSQCAHGDCRSRELVGNTGKCKDHQVQASQVSRTVRDNSTAHGSGTSGVAQQHGPFPTAAGRVPLVSRALALKLCPEGKDNKHLRKISKSLFKEIIKAHDRIDKNENQKTVARAIKDLEEASVRAYSQAQSHSSSGLQV